MGLPRITRSSPRSARRGFTLLETSMALIIIGVGVLAFVEAQRSFMANNEWSSHTARAMYLANEVCELCRRLPRHDPVTGLYFSELDGDQVLQGWGMEENENEPDDIDDIDDLDGVTFGTGGDFAGPIDSYGNVIPQINASGEQSEDEDGNPLGMEGWTQSVVVEKVDPFNYATVRAHEFLEAPQGAFKGRGVDKYPLRVTVTVSYQGPYDSQSRVVATVTWIAP